MSTNFQHSAARDRTGRLPLPRSVTDLTAHDEPALGPANAFIDHLAGLQLAQWLEIGRRVLATPKDDVALHATSWAILDATIADQRLGIAAWHVRDAVETVAFLASHSTRMLSRADRRLFAAAHAAAEDAALATLARAHLPARDVTILHLPFGPQARTAAVER